MKTPLKLIQMRAVTQNWKPIFTPGVNFLAAMCWFHRTRNSKAGSTLDLQSTPTVGFASTIEAAIKVVRGKPAERDLGEGAGAATFTGLFGY